MRTVILTYYRYYALGEEDVDDEHEAVAMGWSMIEWNTAAPDELLDDERNVVLDHAALREKIHQYEDEMIS